MTKSIALRRIRDALISTIALAATATPAAEACGRDTDCAIGERTYRIAFPEADDGTTLSVLVFSMPVFFLKLRVRAKQQVRVLTLLLTCYTEANGRHNKIITWAPGATPA